MPLIDLKTNLKSLKYGADQPGGGNSGQPYIKTNINDPDSSVARNFDDGLVRNGIVGAIKASAVDTLRIGKFLKDLPKGPLFIVKQVGLQLSNPKLETKSSKTGIGFIDKIANVVNDKFGIGPTRIYNLGINTIAQVPVNAFGIHFNRHGLLPVQDDNTKYLAVVQNNNINTGTTNASLPQNSTNRLLKYAAKLLPAPPPKSKPTGVIDQLLSLIPGASLFVKPQQMMIDDYVGGPGSVYGIGRTFIKRYDYTNNGVNKQQPQEKGKINYTGSLGLSNLYFGNTEQINPLAEFNEALGFEQFSPTAITPLAELPTLDKTVINYAQNTPAGANGTSNSPTLRKYKELKSQIDIQSTGSVFNYNETKDTILGGKYNAVIDSYTNKNISYYNGIVTVNLSGSWADLNREKRVGSGMQDLINLTPIFSGPGGSAADTITKLTIPGNPDKNINDLVKFRIQAINGDNPNISDWMIFRAYITQFTDNVDATWNEIKYAGRGDKFYIYDGFNRKVQVNFKVAALSAEEMKPMYQKLNYLMSNLMPDYNGSIMRGPLMKMTIGNWLDGQPAILNSLTYTVPQDSPWEIGLGDKYMILPHIVEVQMAFTPIGSQTQNKNIIPSKSDIISNIAQNYNGANNGEPNYIDPTKTSILKAS